MDFLSSSVQQPSKWPPHIEAEIAKLPWLLPNESIECGQHNETLREEMKDKYGNALMRVEQIQAELAAVERSLNNATTAAHDQEQLELQRQHLQKQCRAMQTHIIYVRARQRRLLKKLRQRSTGAHDDHYVAEIRAFQQLYSFSEPDLQNTAMFEDPAPAPVPAPATGYPQRQEDTMESFGAAGSAVCFPTPFATTTKRHLAKTRSHEPPNKRAKKTDHRTNQTYRDDGDVEMT